MKKKTEMISDQQEFVDTRVHGPEGLDQDERSKTLAQTLQDKEKTTVEDVDSVDDVDVEEKVEELTESLEGGDESGESDESEGLDPEVLARKLEWVLCYVYDVYLRAKKDGEHCPFVQVGDYVFAATMGFTCGHVDEVKVFKEIEKKVLLVFKKKEFEPVEITKDIVNILIEAGGVLEPLDDETLKQL